MKQNSTLLFFCIVFTAALNAGKRTEPITDRTYRITLNFEKHQHLKGFPLGRSQVNRAKQHNETIMEIDAPHLTSLVGLRIFTKPLGPHLTGIDITANNVKFNPRNIQEIALFIQQHKNLERGYFSTNKDDSQKIILEAQKGRFVRSRKTGRIKRKHLKRSITIVTDDTN